MNPKGGENRHVKYEQNGSFSKPLTAYSRVKRSAVPTKHPTDVPGPSRPSFSSVGSFTKLQLRQPQAQRLRCLERDSFARTRHAKHRQPPTRDSAPGRSCGHASLAKLRAVRGAVGRMLGQHPYTACAAARSVRFGRGRALGDLSCAGNTPMRGVSLSDANEVLGASMVRRALPFGFSAGSGMARFHARFGGRCLAGS